MQLTDLTQNLGCIQVVQAANPVIIAITSDSRKVGPGSLFVALVGEQSDGHQYVPQAVASGAAAVLVSRREGISVPEGMALLHTDDPNRALAELSARLVGEPGRTLQMIGVTGTNGKTTVTHLVQQILSHHGTATGLIGTLGIRATGESYETTGHTTPMAPELQALLARLRDEGLKSVVMEVSSHALAQHRVTGCDFAVGVITNLTQDHLDFHKTMEHYAQAKALLFRGLKPGHGTAVINQDDAWAQTFLDACLEGVPVLTYGIDSPHATVRATDLTFSITGAQFTAVTPQGSHPVRLKIAGRFSVYNALAALTTALALNVPLSTAAEALESVPGVRGRFEVVAEKPFVIVDYAHTPDGLENVLNAARQVVPEGGRLISVFGCGGDRDATKRPKMGHIAERLSDLLVVTSDNPRSEDPQQILTDILAGIERFDPSRMRVDADRQAAIHLAIELAQPNDVVVVAGKGHEDYQILADRTIHFDDKEVVQAFLAQRRVPS